MNDESKRTLDAFLLHVAANPNELEGATLEQLAEKFGLGEDALRLLKGGTLKQIKVKVNLELEVDGAKTAFSWIHIWIH